MSNKVIFNLDELFISVGIDVGADFSWMSIALPNQQFVGKPYKILHNSIDSLTTLLYTGSSFSLWKVTKIIFLFHQNYFSRKKFCGYRFRLHVLLLKLSTVSINSLLRRVEFIDFCGWFLHASFLSDHFFRVIHMKK